MANVNLQGAVPTPPQYQQGENYVLHDPNITQNPAYYKELLAGAKRSIRILDPYALTESDASKVFQAVNCHGIKIEIYTTRYDEAEINAFTDSVQQIFVTKQQNYTLNVYSFKTSGVCCNQNISLWHDRYLIIDDTDFYLIGSSVDAQQLSLRYHGIYHLDKKKDIDIVVDLYKHFQNSYNPIRGIKTLRRLP